jgi:zinc transporter 7
MRYLSSLAGEDGEHSHGHSHSHSAPVASSATSTAVSNGDASTLKKRGNGSKKSSAAIVVEAEDKKDPGQSLKLGAYLNLFADFTHNITDGLAMAASFYASPTIGATTTLACFAHEIPHEIADYSILIKSGFSKRQAMGSQFITAVGAFVGTGLGIWIQSISSASTSHLPDTPDLVGALLTRSTGLLGTSLQYSDLTIPIVSGSFTYVGAVMVVPEILADSKSGKQLVKELLAMTFGITWYVPNSSHPH